MDVVVHSASQSRKDSYGAVDNNGGIVKLDGPSLDTTGIPLEHSPESGIVTCICFPIRFVLDIFAWLWIVLNVIPIILCAICFALYGLLCCSRAHRRKMKRFGNFGMWLRNKVLTSTPYFWWPLFHVPVVRDKFNIIITASTLAEFGAMCGNMVTYDMHHDYTCLPVYDKRGVVYSRGLPSADDKWIAQLPDTDKVSDLFVRDSTKPMKIEKNRNSSILLAYYAQWLTHQFFNTSPDDPNYTNQPVGFNLGQLYGSLDGTTNRLRLHKGGLLKSSYVNGFEWLPIVVISEETSDKKFIPVYKRLGMMGKLKFDTAIELSNFTPGFMALQTLWFRHHQYIARTLSKMYKDWDDNRIFQIAKIINLLCVFQVTVNDYVRCISNKYAVSLLTPHLVLNLFKSWIFKVLGPKKWHTSIYSITAEFNLLYRWHQMLPDKIRIAKKLDTSAKTLDDLDCTIMNHLDSSVVQLLGDGPYKADGKYDNNLERILFSAHLQHSGLLSLKNTNEWLAKNVVKAGLDDARTWRLRGYNEYRGYAGMKPLDSIDDLTDDPIVTQALKDTYGTIDNLEYYPGVFAGEKDDGGFHAPLLTYIGGAWTFLGLFSIPIIKEANLLEIIKPVSVKILEKVPNLDALAALHSNLPRNSISFFAKTPAPK